MGRISVVPASAGGAAKSGWIRQPNVDVEEARKAVLAAKEPATTYKYGAKVPKFIQDAEALAARTQTAPTELSPLQKRAAIAAEARQKLIRAGVNINQRLNLIALQDRGILTAEDVKALVDHANNVPIEEPKEEDKIESAEPIAPASPTPPVPTSPAQSEPERQPLAAPTASAPAAPAAPPAVPAAPSAESSDATPRVVADTNLFTVSYYKDKDSREWVGNLVYKNGAGPERFTAPTKDALLEKLLIAKANATLKIRKTVGQLKLGTKNDTWDYFFNQTKEKHGMSLEEYNALPEASRNAIMEAIIAQESVAFLEHYPEYYPCQENVEAINDFLNEKGWPLTYRNLVIAYNELLDDGLLRFRPTQNVPASSTPTPAPVVAAPTAVPTVSESAVPAAPAVSAAPAASAAPIAPAAPAPVLTQVSAPPVTQTAADPAVLETTAASAAVAPPAAPVVRKRVSSGLVPGSSSAITLPKVSAEEGTKQSEPSEAELKTMPLDQLARIAKKGWNSRRLY